MWDSRTLSNFLTGPSGELITDILQRLLLPSFPLYESDVQRERIGRTDGLITHYYCDILWWSAAATCHLFDDPNGKTTINKSSCTTKEIFARDRFDSWLPKFGGNLRKTLKPFHTKLTATRPD